MFVSSGFVAFLGDLTVDVSRHLDRVLEMAPHSF